MINLLLSIFYFISGRLNRILIFKNNIYLRISKGSKIKIGKNFSSRSGSKIFAKRGAVIEIGDNVFLNHNVHIYANSSVIVGNDTIFGPNTYIFDHNHKIDDNGAKNDELIYGNVRIGNNVWIGSSCNILAGSNIGNNSIIAAGSTVKKVIPEKSIYSLDTSSYKIKNLI